jgi:hypothetical protein
MVWSWKASMGASRRVRASPAVRSSGQPVAGRWGSRKKPSRSAPALVGRPNSQCWNTRARSPSGAAPSSRAVGVNTGQPTDGRSNDPVAMPVRSASASMRNTTRDRWR